MPSNRKPPPKATLSVPQLTFSWLVLMAVLYATVPQLFHNGVVFTLIVACASLALMAPVSFVVERLAAAVQAHPEASR